MKQVQLSIEKSKLLPVLKQLAVIERSVRRKNTTLEVTVKSDLLELVVPGAALHVEAVSDGAVKFNIKLMYFKDIIESEKQKVLQFIVTEHALKLREFTFSVYTTFFENDRILRSIDLPVNYTTRHLAELYLSGKYTPEVFEFNNLSSEVQKAYKKTEQEIHKIAVMMKPFGFHRREVEQIIRSKITKGVAAN